LIGKDEKISAQKSLSRALQYRLSTPAQFLMILENQGYIIARENGIFKISKFGPQLGTIDQSRLTEHMSVDKLSQDRR